MVAFSEQYQKQERTDQWWAFSQSHGWVVLDRSLLQNRITDLPEEFQFIRCRDWRTYEQGEQPWNYREAQRHLNSLSPEEAMRARSELAKFQEQFDATFNAAA